MSGWNISKELRELDELIDLQASQNDGEISDELAAAFDAMGDEFRSMADDYAWLIRKKMAEQKMFADEAKRLGEYAKRLGSQVDRLKNEVKNAIEALGEKKIGAFSICATGGKLPLELTDEVPEEFIRYTPAVDNEKIRKELTSGKSLPFAKLGERGNHLRIRG